MITWITSHDNTEPFKTMAENLAGSIFKLPGASCSHVVTVKPNGGQCLAEFYCAMYPIFSQAIQSGPVVILDTDCIVQKPIDHLFEKDFAMAGIYRGRCTISQGRQNFLGCFIAFHPKDPNLVRQLWLEWIARIYPYVRGTEKGLVAEAAIRHEQMREKGWNENWYIGQTAYNDMMFDAEEKGIPILRLDRKEYAAKPGDKDACITHDKGRGKLK